MTSNRSNKLKIFCLKNFENSNFHCHIWNHHEKWEKVYFRSQILERPSIGEYWNISGVPVLPENVIFTFFRTCWCYSEAYNTGTQKWSSTVQYSCTSIWDLKYTFSEKCIQMSTNKLGIGLVVLEIGLCFLENVVNFNFVQLIVPRDCKALRAGFSCYLNLLKYFWKEWKIYFKLVQVLIHKWFFHFNTSYPP